MHVGTDELTLTGGTIEVFNDAGTSIKNDGYDFRWESFRGTSMGSLYGDSLDFFRVLIVDDDLDMLSSTDLPTDPSFASAGDYIQDDFTLTGGQSFGLSESSGPGRSFTLSTPSPVPVPSAIWLVGFGLPALVGRNRARPSVGPRTTAQVFTVSKRGNRSV